MTFKWPSEKAKQQTAKAGKDIQELIQNGFKEVSLSIEGYVWTMVDKHPYKDANERKLTFDWVHQWFYQNYEIFTEADLEQNKVYFKVRKKEASKMNPISLKDILTGNKESRVLDSIEDILSDLENE